MFDRLIDYFLSEPRWLVRLGATLVQTGGFLFVAGLVGQVATTAVSAVRRVAIHARPDVALAEVLPDYLNWWMPEGLPGFAMALLLLVTGLVVIRTGRVYQRWLAA